LTCKDDIENNSNTIEIEILNKESAFGIASEASDKFIIISEFDVQ
jgi:hypothetical protein